MSETEDCFVPNHHLNDSESQGFNFSLEIYCNIFREKPWEVPNVSTTTEITLIVVYSFLIVGGLITNLLVSFVVARRRQMHTARNLYIVNLTISNLSMCFITMPFTLMMILRRGWSMGWLLCKLVPVSQGTNIMVSIGTITVIALDRYFTICKRTTQDVASTRRRVVISIVAIWFVSFLSVFPLFAHQVLEPLSLHDLVLYEVCIEHWPSKQSRVLYDTAVLLVMAVIPPLVVAVVHARIANYLNAHTKTQKDSARARREIERNRRTTLLLSGIVVIFVVSWLPLATFALLSDLFVSPDSTTNMYTALAIVHILAMTSAITNPIVYGWLNSNIRKEFLDLLPQTCAAKCRGKSKNNLVAENETVRTNVNLNRLNDRKESIALLVTLSNVEVGQADNSSHL